MSDFVEKTGNCLCRTVRISAKTPNTNVGACHCGMCRKWGGGPFMTVDCGADVSFEGEESISVFDSSEWAERGFCKKMRKPSVLPIKTIQTILYTCRIIR